MGKGGGRPPHTHTPYSGQVYTIQYYNCIPAKYLDTKYGGGRVKTVHNIINLHRNYCAHLFTRTHVNWGRNGIFAKKCKI